MADFNQTFQIYNIKVSIFWYLEQVIPNWQGACLKKTKIFIS